MFNNIKIKYKIIYLVDCNIKHSFYLKYVWGLGIGDWGLGPIPNP